MRSRLALPASSLAALVISAACSGETGSNGVKGAPDGATDGPAIDGSTDAASEASATDAPIDAPPPDVTCSCAACCMPDGTCGTGFGPAQCGNPGEICKDCTATGEDCRGVLGGGHRCAIAKPNGSPCKDGADCLSNNCSDQKICYSPCVPSKGDCLPGGGACCETDETCDTSGPGFPPGQCCVPVGQITTSCNKCCDGLGCSDLPDNKVKCGPP